MSNRMTPNSDPDDDARAAGYRDLAHLGTDDDARAAGYRDAAEWAYALRVGKEQDLTEQWIEAGAPTELEMVEQLGWLRREAEGKVPAAPLTVQEAARRLKVHPKTIRRRVDAWAAMTPPLAYRIGEGERAPWRILPAALEVAPATVEPEPAKPARGRRQQKPQKRSTTRWEA